MNYALIDEDTGKAYDSAGKSATIRAWIRTALAEGGGSDRAMLPSVPAGRYYLRIEPESEASFGVIQYKVTVTRDVPVLRIYLLALAALLLPALLISWRTYNFEQMRWAESDHPMKSIRGNE